MQITVVITTHDRPALLREAIASVEAQHFDEWDIVVVDDGSTPAVMQGHLPGDPAGRIRLLRHGAAQGPSAARNTGMQAATGEAITFLDDDDLLDADALAKIDAAFRDDASLNCLFVNVEPFGSDAEGTRYNQKQAMSRVLGTMGEHLETAEGVIRLHPDLLFAALLERIPMAFQRVAIKRAQLQKVGLYRGEGFEDLEWYYRVALRCVSGLLVMPCYRVRCEGQSYFSRPEEKQRLIDTIIRIRKGLLSLDEVAATPLLKRMTTASLASAHFNRAYYAYQNGQPFPWRNLFDSTVDGLYWHHVSLAGKALKNHIRKAVTRRREC
ncbi:MAG: glycosyltransferase family 2 protein [Hydrogenophilales bacterium]|nr:glycosyltransferase family 2 protein [Hydrogenophilales bacterium]